MPHRLQLLLIDDDFSDIQLLRDQLTRVESVPCELDVALSLRAALTRLAAGRPYHAVLLGGGHPECTLVEALSRLADVDRTLPLVVLSHDLSLVDVEQAEAHGAQDCLHKTADPALMIRAIRFAVERRNMQVEREMLERQIQQSQKLDAIGTLAGGIAHDINNMLTPVLALAEVGRMRDHPEFNEIFEEIRDSVLHASDLVQQILVYSHRAHDDDPEAVAIHYAVAQAMKLVRKTIPATIQIRQEIPLDAGIVRVDRTAIQQVVLNLCINAAQAMEPHGGQLEIEVSTCLLDAADVTAYRPDGAAGAYACLRVSDTGRGIPEGIRARIFEPFFTTKKIGHGTGLGLTVSQGVVKRHGGFITVESIVNQGTTFRVFLPLIEADYALPRPDEELAPGGSERIMLVDDEPRLLEAVRLLLEHLGYDVRAFGDSMEALSWLEGQTTCPVDLLITDQTMPRMTGLQFAQRALRCWPDLPVVVTTGYSDHLGPEAIAEAGIQEVFYKPFEPRALARQLRRVFAAEPSPRGEPSECV